MEHDRISSMTQRLTEEIGAHSPLLLDEFPISRYIQHLDDYPEVCVCTAPKKFILKGGLKQFIDGLFVICIGFDGFKPVYEVHIDSHDPDFMAEFNPEGWLRFFKRIVSMMEMDQRISGGYGIAWFLDPELETVSPKLTYIRKVVVDNGGKLFYIGPSESATRDALSKSPTRRKLYMEGKYIPTNYMAFWPRENLINWVNSLG